MNFSSDLSTALLYQSENDFYHDSYSKELEFFNAVKSGDVETVKKLYSPLNSEGMGKLSDNSLNNIRYHFVVSVAMITRFCMEGGMPSETAFTLSDLYIRKADKIHSEDGITSLHKNMIIDFTERMGELQNQSSTNSKAITLAMEYINKNIRTPIQLEEIAEFAKVSTSYLSTLFKKETGETLSTYIQKTRVAEAKNMLKFTDMEFIDISNYLCFSSHSHFIAVFKKFEGITPKAYRDKFYRTHFVQKESEKPSSEKTE